MNHVTGASGFRFVSLGGDCQPAAQIRNVQPTNPPNVFDAVTTEIRHLARLIEDDFAGFLEPANMFPVYFEQEFRGAVDTRYRVGFNHDFSSLEPEAIDFVRGAYGMRIRWFRNLFNPRRPPPYFVRRWHPRDGKEDEALPVALFEQLRRKRADIRLLYLHADPTRAPVMLDGYRSTFLPQTEPFLWYGDTDAWKAILTDFAVRPFAGDRDAFRLTDGALPADAFLQHGPRFA